MGSQSITGGYPGAHGAPIHWGNPEAIGVQDINTPDYGDEVEVKAGEVCAVATTTPTTTTTQMLSYAKRSDRFFAIPRTSMRAQLLHE